MAESPDKTGPHPVVEALINAFAAMPICGDIPVTSIAQSGRCDLCTAVMAAPLVLRYAADGLCCGGELYRIADEIEWAGPRAGDTQPTRSPEDNARLWSRREAIRAELREDIARAVGDTRDG